MIDTRRQRWPKPKRARAIVLIGAGGIVRAAHLPAYRAAGLSVAGVFDVRSRVAEQLARDHAIPRVFASLDEAARQRDVVFDVAVPADALLAVLRALPVGSAVLMQKPMGRDLGEARRIAAHCANRRFIAAVNFQLRFAPNMLVLQRRLACGELGKVVDVELRTRTHTPWSNWTFLRGIERMEILYHSIHGLDLLRSMFGMPRRVRALASRDASFRGYADTRCSIALEFDGDARATIVTAHSHEFAPRTAASQLLVEGTKAAALADMGVNLDYPKGRPDSLALCARGGDWRSIELEGSWFPDAFAGTMCNLQRCVSGEDPVLHTRVDDALSTMALVEACYRDSTRQTPIPHPR